MTRSQDLYQAICDAAGKNALTDTDIHKIVLFLQRSLRQSGDTADFSIGQLVHIDPNIP